MFGWSKIKNIGERAIEARCKGQNLSSWKAYVAALSIQACVFYISFSFHGESEAVFSLINILIAIFIAIFVGQGAGIVAGVLAALSVDYHYIRPVGSVLDTWEGFAFLALSVGLVQFTLAGLRLLQTSLIQAREAKDQAQRAVQAREEILGIVAHDLRQPLTLIGMRAELLQKAALNNLTDPANEFLKGILTDAHRMNRMIGDLLDLSQIDSGQLSVQCKNIGLNQATKMVVSSFLNNKERCALRVTSNSDLTVSADSDRFQQILGNLISNAIKYGIAGSEIQIELVDRGVNAEIVVTNHGAGIPKEQLAKVFERFARAPEARSRHIGGLGLGLYITRRLVEAQGGKIWVKSELGRTTSFHFTLPHVQSTTLQKKILP